MSGRYLLDTSVAIRVLNQKVDLEARRGHRLEVFLCPTVVGELAFGAEKSSNAEANRDRIDGLIQVCPVVPQDIDTAYRYGAIKAALQKKGQPIPENDLWIAACALRHGLILAARGRPAMKSPGYERRPMKWGFEAGFTRRCSQPGH